MFGLAILLGLIFLIGAITVLVGLGMVITGAISKQPSKTGLKVLMWGGLMLLGSFTLCSTIMRW